jgi:hydroxymethylbilane synthase
MADLGLTPNAFCYKNVIVFNRMRKRIVIGTRKSPLALWQSEHIKSLLAIHFPSTEIVLKHFITKGDKSQELSIPLPEIGGKGLFTAELEQGLLAKEIDLAVHSLKDLPTTLASDFILGAIPEREVVEDVLISRSGLCLKDLPAGATIGTSSLRRSSQLLRLRPDLKTAHIRGNVDTRIRKAKDSTGIYDATVLASAGLTRLGLVGEVTEVLSCEDMLPAPGQGALGIECRANDHELRGMLQTIHHAPTEIAVTAERAFLAALEAGCNTPVAALARIERVAEKELIVFKGRCVSADGIRAIEVRGEAQLSAAYELGVDMAKEALERGFKDL